MDDVGGVAHQGPAGADDLGGAGLHQRPGGAGAVHAQLARRAARCGIERGVELGVVHLREPLGLGLRHRPDDAVRALGLRAVERQQRQHVGRAEPLAGDAGVGHVGHHAGRQRAVAVGVALERDAQPVARRGGLALGDHRERRLRVGRHHGHRRGEARGRLQHLFQLGRVDDPGQRRHRLLPCGEGQRALGVACDAHVVDGRAGIRRHAVPHLELAQQLHRGRVEGVGAHVGALLAAGRRGRAGVDAHGQSLAGQLQGQGAGDDAAAVDSYVDLGHSAL